MAQAGNFLENKIAAKLFSDVDFSIPNWYGALVNIPLGSVVEDQDTATLYSYELDSATHGGYTGRFEITWNVLDNSVSNTNTVQWTATDNWASVPTHVFVFDSQTASSGDLLFYSQIPGLPGTILQNDVVKMKPNRITITID
tara:strand:+ start:133 stop:558 length:426 start_codon:yes stop_codon:yes gene_type:complete